MMWLCSVTIIRLCSVAGIVFSFGDNEKGQLGRRGNTNLPLPISFSVSILQIACGSEFSLFLYVYFFVWS